MKKYFEYTDAVSYKFWEINLKGKQVTLTYGRIGIKKPAQIVKKFKGKSASEDAKKFAGNIIVIFTTVTVTIVVIIEIFMPTFILFLAPGFALNDEKLDELINTSRIIFPFLVIISVGSIYSSILNANNKFA